VTSDANALPGVTFIAGDGHIVHRQIATAKDDRMTAAEVIATADRVFGTSGPATDASGYAALDRAQVRVDAGGGSTLVGDVQGLFPIGHHVLVGPSVSLSLHDVDLDGAIVVRQPFWAGLGAIEVGLSGGYTPSATWNASARAGLWFADGPRWSFYIDAGATFHDDSHVLFGVIGVARLLQIR
jgi:hypothetical protein